MEVQKAREAILTPTKTMKYQLEVPLIIHTEIPCLKIDICYNDDQMHFSFCNSRTIAFVNLSRLQRQHLYLGIMITYSLHQKVYAREEQFIDKISLFSSVQNYIQFSQRETCSTSVAVLGTPALVVQEVKTPGQALSLFMEIYPSQIYQTAHVTTP